MDELFSQKKFAILKFTPGEKLTIKRLQYSIQQLFVARYISSGFKKRLFLYHDMGSGKTVGSLLTAEENKNLYKILGEGTVIILGFQRETFMNEMLSKPDLGYISDIEYEKLQSYDLKNHTEAEKYERYKTMLKRRILTAEHIKFIGYQELYNMLFYEGNVVKEVLQYFSNAFIICDEIHNVYNSQETNIYGEAIKFILDHYVGKEDEPRILFMSGTPINNKPSEIVDILNLVVPGTNLKKSELFKIDDVETLLPGALGRIKSIADGYFSVYMNEDPNFLPRRFFDGKQIGMLKFNEVPYSKGQEKVIKETNGKISIEDHNILDGAFPLPNGELLYRNKDLMKLQFAPDDWKQKMGIEYNETITGSILAENNIKEYSPKYWHILQELKKFIKDPMRRGKLLIYHDFINGFGVKLIEQILISNGYLSLNGMINNNSICVKCGELYKDHSGHEFEPVRFVSVYGELDKTTVNENLEFFNSKSNAEGDKFLILIGSEMIREGYNFNCIREVWISHVMPYASAMLQLWGRAIRLHGHQMLPPEKRTVHLKIFANELEIKQYTKKMENYQIIQEIMRVINMNAIDIDFYYDFIKQSFKKKGDVGLLEYPRRPVIRKIIKLDSYDVFFGEWEVEEIKKIIEALFTSYSPMWTYADLWAAVKNPPFTQYIDCSKFKEDNFVLALGDMIYGLYPTIIKDAYKIMPVFNKVAYYVIFPVEAVAEMPFGKKLENIHGVAKPYFISWMRPAILNKNVAYQLNDSFINLNTKYSEMKHKFYEKFNKSDMLDIPKSTELYGNDFHVKLLEESITYVFNILINKDKNRSEYHEFYFKLIFFYNKLDLIIYASMLPDKYADLYKTYVVGEINTNTMLMSIISNIDSSVSSFDMSNVEKFLKTNTKTASNILPVGHMLNLSLNKTIEPKLYTPQGWMVVQNFKQDEIESRENDIIVGYYEKIDNFLDFKFKLRSPVHKIEQKSDKRETEKGMVCNTIKKDRLYAIAESLGIKLNITITDICNEIKKTLLHLELKDRNMYRLGKVPIRTRYCYMPYENV